jgi:hypothetical protein
MAAGAQTMADFTSIRDLLKAQPFIPFDVRTASGEVHRIKHPEMGFLAGMWLIVYYPELNQTRLVSQMQVTEIEFAMAVPGMNGSAIK